VVLEAAEAVEATIMKTQTLKELGIERKKVPSNIRNEKSPLDFCSISDRSVSSGGTLLPWVSITALASLGAVKPTLGSKVPPLETLLPDMEKKSSGFFISDDGKRHSHDPRTFCGLLFTKKMREIQLFEFLIVTQSPCQ